MSVTPHRSLYTYVRSANRSCFARLHCPLSILHDYQHLNLMLQRASRHLVIAFSSCDHRMLCSRTAQTHSFVVQRQSNKVRPRVSAIVAGSPNWIGRPYGISWTLRRIHLVRRAPPGHPYPAFGVPHFLNQRHPMTYSRFHASADIRT